MARHPIEVNGVTYPSKLAACRAFGVAPSVFGYRRARGATLRQALGLEIVDKERRCWGDGGVMDQNGSYVACGAYHLYEIINSINGKTYVGITIQPLDARFRHHQYLARKGGNHPLSRAMRKYGLDKFEIRAIRMDALNGAELQRQEVAEIAHRNSTDPRFGYNLHPGGTSGRRRPVHVGDMQFESRAAAATYFGISASTFCLRIGRLGWTPEQAAEIEPAPNAIRSFVMIEGQRLSLRAAAKQLGVPYGNASLRVNNGWTPEQALGLVPLPSTRNLYQTVVVDELTFQTLASAATHFGVDYKVVHARIHVSKWSVRQALGLDEPPRAAKLGRSVEAFGIFYPSLSACARAHGVKLSALHRRVHTQGEAAERAIQHLRSQSPSPV